MKEPSRMKGAILLFFITLLTISCEEFEDQSEPHNENFAKRTVELNRLDSLESGKSYLPVHSRIESLPEHKTHYLTIAANIRNLNANNTVFITKAQYLDTNANRYRTILKKLLMLLLWKPLRW